MYRCQILINALTSAVQIISVSAVLFVLYKFLLHMFLFLSGFINAKTPNGMD